jgi:hypothetical protein
MDSSFNRLLTINNKTKINKFTIFTKDCGIIFKNYDDSAAIYTKKDDAWVKEMDGGFITKFKPVKIKDKESAIERVKQWSLQRNQIEKIGKAFNVFK